MTYHLGVDLGTSSTTAAVHRAGRVGVVGLGEHSAAMPSVLVWRPEGPPLVGDAAVRHAAAGGAGAASGMRARLTDPMPMTVDGAPMAASALLGVLLRRVVDRVAEREGGAPAGIVLTHPATWGAQERDVFAGVADALGLGKVALVSEPEAVARQYAAQDGLRDGAVLAVVGVGGDSLDVTVLVHREGGFTILGRPESRPQPVGAQPGDDIVVAGLARTLASAGLTAADLDTVILAGWSTRMGTAAAALADAVGRPVAVDPEPEHAVALGAARLAARFREDGATRMVSLSSSTPARAPAPGGTPVRPSVDRAPSGPISAPISAPPRPAPISTPISAPTPTRVAPVAHGAEAGPARRARPRRRGLATGLAAAVLALGALGGGAIALASAAAPAVAAPGPVINVPPPPPATETPTTTTTTHTPTVYVAETVPTTTTTTTTRRTTTSTSTPRLDPPRSHDTGSTTGEHGTTDGHGTGTTDGTSSGTSSGTSTGTGTTDGGTGSGTGTSTGTSGW
ncbi:Hsp70 family protein [Actinomycetospora sp. C-140]